MWNYKCAYCIGWVIGYFLGWVALATSLITGEDVNVVLESLLDEAMPTLQGIDRFFGIGQ